MRLAAGHFIDLDQTGPAVAMPGRFEFIRSRNGGVAGIEPATLPV